MISVDSAAPDLHVDFLCAHAFGARPPADRPFHRTRRVHRGIRSQTSRARRQAISDARYGGEIALDIESALVSYFNGRPNVDRDVNCDSLNTSARLLENKPSLHTEIVVFFFFYTWCEPHTLETRGDKLYNRVFTRAHVQHRPLDGLV